jgi:hypothetical protein
MKHLSSRVSVALVFACALYVLTPLALRAWQGRARRQMAGVAANQILQDTASPPPFAGTDRKTLEAQNQLEIRLNVQRLYALATELKDEVDQTDSGAVLSMSAVKRAGDIEKLARQIKDRVKR